MVPASDDPVFRSDAGSLGTLLSRQRLLDEQFQAMQGPWYMRALQVAYAADPAIREETYNAYTYQVLLSPSAIGWAMAGALLFSFIIEGFVRLVDWVVLGGKRQRERIARRERSY